MVDLLPLYYDDPTLNPADADCKTNAAIAHIET